MAASSSGDGLQSAELRPLVLTGVEALLDGDTTAEPCDSSSSELCRDVDSGDGWMLAIRDASTLLACVPAAECALPPPLSVSLEEVAAGNACAATPSCICVRTRERDMALLERERR